MFKCSVLYVLPVLFQSLASICLGSMPTRGHYARGLNNVTVKTHLLRGHGGCVVLLNAVKTGLFVIIDEWRGLWLR